MSLGTFRAAAAWLRRDPLLLSGTVLLALVPLLLAAAALDERSLFGRSPWDKPLRFALSLGVYAVTMAMASQWLRARTRIPCWRWLSPVLIGFLVFELTWIVVQAVRGDDNAY